MRSPSEMLVQTTWMQNDDLFNYHDSITPIDWESTLSKVYENESYTADQLVMVAILEFLCDSEDVEVSLDEISSLENHDRQAVLDALRAKWIGHDIQENLE